MNTITGFAIPASRHVSSRRAYISGGGTTTLSAPCLPMGKAWQRVVLVVEDEVLIRIGAVDAFQDGGFIVIEAEHSAAALLTALEYPHIDLLFTDVNMPGDLDGIGLAEHLFTLRPCMKIITSALPLLRNVDHMKASFLPKPYDVLGLCSLGEGLLAA